jgi:hypothetical protein
MIEAASSTTTSRSSRFGTSIFDLYLLTVTRSCQARYGSRESVCSTCQPDELSTSCVRFVVRSAVAWSRDRRHPSRRNSLLLKDEGRDDFGAVLTATLMLLIRNPATACFITAHEKPRSAEIEARLRPHAASGVVENCVDKIAQGRRLPRSRIPSTPALVHYPHGRTGRSASSDSSDGRSHHGRGHPALHAHLLRRAACRSGETGGDP